MLNKVQWTTWHYWRRKWLVIKQVRSYPMMTQCADAYRWVNIDAGNAWRQQTIIWPVLTNKCSSLHYIDVVMTTMASQITSLTVVYSIVYSDADQRKHQSSASPAFVWGIHRDRWIPRTNGQLRGKCFHLMTSSWRESRVTNTNDVWFCPLGTVNHPRFGFLICTGPTFEGLIIWMHIMLQISCKVVWFDIAILPCI